MIWVEQLPPTVSNDKDLRQRPCHTLSKLVVGMRNDRPPKYPLSCTCDVIWIMHARQPKKTRHSLRPTRERNTLMSVARTLRNRCPRYHHRVSSRELTKCRKGGCCSALYLQTKFGRFSDPTRQDLHLQCLWIGTDALTLACWPLHLGCRTFQTQHLGNCLRPVTSSECAHVSTNEVTATDSRGTLIVASSGGGTPSGSLS